MRGVGKPNGLSEEWDGPPRESDAEAAIETACGLLDEGSDVFGIGTGPLTDTIARIDIARIYAIWAREKRPFGQISS
jgi:hypothetical protein